MIAREFALLIIEAPFFPDVRHTPEVAHVVADEWPRAFMLGRAGEGTEFSLLVTPRGTEAT